MTFEYILHILPLPWSKLFDDIQPINKNRNPVPWKRPWPRQRDRCHGENWEGPCIPGPNQQKTGERCTDIAFFMLFLYLFVFLFICLFVAGSLLILMFHFQQSFFPSFLMAESKSPNEMKERDVEVLKQDSEQVKMWWLVGGLIRRERVASWDAWVTTWVPKFQDDLHDLQYWFIKWLDGSWNCLADILFVCLIWYHYLMVILWPLLSKMFFCFSAFFILSLVQPQLQLQSVTLLQTKGALFATKLYNPIEVVDFDWVVLVLVLVEDGWSWLWMWTWLRSV